MGTTVRRHAILADQDISDEPNEKYYGAYILVAIWFRERRPRPPACVPVALTLTPMQLVRP